MPSIGDLFQGIPGSAFDHYQVMTFTISVISKPLTLLSAGDIHLECAGDKANCKIQMKRDYTPYIHYISPRVTYYESNTMIVFNPMNVMNLIKDLQTDELPFINFKVGGNLLDFDGSVDYMTTFTANKKNSVRA